MNTLAVRGSIWTVPELGGDALCLLLSDQRGLTRGRPEFQVVPLMIADAHTLHGALDFKLRSNETTLGIELFAALWNSRPLLGEDLGELRGHVMTEIALNELRDAYLRLADPSISVPDGRLGLAASSSETDRERSAAIEMWGRLSRRVLQRLVEPQRVVFELSSVFDIDSDWSCIYLDQLDGLAQRAREGDSLVGSAIVVASGVATGIVNLRLWSEKKRAMRLFVLTPNSVVYPVTYHRDSVEVHAEPSPFDTQEMCAVAGLAEAT